MIGSVSMARTGAPTQGAPWLRDAGLADVFEQQVRECEQQRGPLGPGPLTPPDPTLGAPANVPAGPSPGQAMQEAATVGAFTATGAIIGGVVGGVTLPVVGIVPGEVVGGVIGSGVGAAWVAFF